MANFTALKTAINNAIKTNGNEEITGAILQAILDAMVETLGDSAINNLENAITTEVTNRENAVGGVADDLAAEVQARQALDYNVNNRINAEEYNRQNADAALSQTMNQGFQTLGSQMTALNAAISALNAAYQNGFLYGGIATPSSSPSNNKCFYIALQGGTYTNFGGVGVIEGINIIKNDSGWEVVHIYDQTTLLNEFYLLRQQVIRALASYEPIVVYGDVTNAPDEEDLTSNAQHLLKFKDRDYSPLSFSGLGMKILRKNILPLNDSVAFNGFLEGVTAEETLAGSPELIFWDRMNTRFVGIKDGIYYAAWTDDDNYVPVSTSLVYMYNGTPYQWTGSDFIVDETEVPNLVNCLTQDMINEANTIYIIRYDYTLKEDITIPANCVLQFDGGSISGEHTITGTDTGIQARLVKIFNTNTTLAGTWNITESYPEWFGAKGDGVTDDTVSLEKCFNFSSLQSVTARLSAKTYIVAPNKETAWNVQPTQSFYVLHTAFLMHSNMRVVGDDLTVLKLKDNYVTPSNQYRFFLFFTNEVIENVSFINITFDLNGINNRINTTGLTFRVQQSAIGVSSVYNGVVDAKIDNVLIDRCKFFNCPGGNVIITGVTNNNISTKQRGKHWVISNCLFKNNGLDSDDHSTIYAYADDVLCVNNVFTADNPFPNGLYPTDPQNGTYNAYEVHGDNQTFSGNVVENYRQGLWVTPIDSILRNTFIQNNKFINLFRTVLRAAASDGKSINNIIIENNYFEIAASGKDLGITTNIAFSFEISDGTLYKANINGNTIKFLNNDTSLVNIGVSLSSNCYNTKIDNNIFNRNSNCVYIAADSQVGDTFIRGNIFEDVFTGTNSVTGKAIAIFTTQTIISCLFITGNTYKGDNSIKEGISLKGTVNKLIISNENVLNVLSYYVNYGAILPNKDINLDKIAFDPAWREGSDLIDLGQSGIAKGYYSIKGKMVIATATLDIGNDTILTPGKGLFFNLPYNNNKDFIAIGRVRIIDQSESTFNYYEVKCSDNNNRASLENSGSPTRLVYTDSPIVLAAGDSIFAQIIYFIN